LLIIKLLINNKDTHLQIFVSWNKYICCMPVKRLVIALLFIALLGFVSFNYLAFYFWMQYQKPGSRLGALQSGNSVEMLSVPNSELFRNSESMTWKDANKEVVMDGTYYEVLKISRGAYDTKVFVIADDKETRRHSGFFTMQKKLGNELSNIFKLFSGLVFFGCLSPWLLAPRYAEAFAFSGLRRFYAFLFALKLIKPPCA